MRPDPIELTPRAKCADVSLVAKKALLELLEPLVGFVLDSGLSTRELHSILREAAVRSVANRQLDVARRVNISGIAASTGIPRGEISRILKLTKLPSSHFTDRGQQATNRILAVWYQDPKFTTPAGKPADLKMYGRGVTFEALVRRHGRGIPPRAMLDELTRSAAAEILTSGLVRAKASVAIDRGVTPRAIRSFGERATELLSTMVQNMRNPDKPKFIASISGTNISPEIIPLFREKLASRGADFLSELHDYLLRETRGSTRLKKPVPRTSRVSVTIFYHEAPRKSKAIRGLGEKRRNFRRVG